MTALTFALLLLPVIAFVIFWKYSVEHKRVSLERFSISVSLCLWAMINILWESIFPRDSGWGGRLGFGSTFAVLVRWIIKSLPTIAPEMVELLKLEEKPLRKSQPLLASFLVFIYIVIGYLCVAVFFNIDPRIFLLNIESKWWVILIALFVAAIWYLYSIRKEAEAGKLDRS